MLPPVTAVQALPFQYSTSYCVSPKLLNVIVSVGSDGLLQLSCNVTTSISSMVLLPLKSISSQSGNVLAGAASFQLPWALSPLRSPSLVVFAPTFPVA